MCIAEKSIGASTSVLHSSRTNQRVQPGNVVHRIMLPLNIEPVLVLHSLKTHRTKLTAQRVGGAHCSALIITFTFNWSERKGSATPTMI